MKRGPYLIVVLTGLFGFLLAAIILLPIVWGAIVSLKTRVDALSMPPQWVFSPTLEAINLDFPSSALQLDWNLKV